MQKNRLIKKANRIARRAGRWKATEIIIGLENRVIDYIPNGYRKLTDDQYVPRSYLRRYGWKNTYYQHMICRVEINPHS